ncbi:MULTISPECIES: SDR family NAD(P)-dependent oxidoreductase [Streptomyces]|uniref:Short-chain dehydrogenase/reductase SDR n=1 Tax=Streptomyces albus (strain ATCC 21838 / DSM 41398 / FERM P-419 / JCM 4703 / NBRC 107858) TaxID=1081613 RepID=A0A0B5EQL0_STRA4|nr:glucose 1-dehydrogenase [Streptomyces sp. SCSIO ZS0520]AJE85053.1 short-chain dehydrogenase/reductase SDR [Streptomyces albus]AOU79360.1 short-chain dehydrogenase/reductase SDR [Streptomyces albus]AYN35086.1 3-oxoacyl-ACP reductase [Streptomyces albus]
MSTAPTLTATGAPVPEAVPTPAALFDLSGSVVLVTGASGGLGARFASVAAAAGARVVLAARRAERLAEVAADCPGALAVPCDVTSAADRARLVDTAVEHFGRLDVLVNNAGAARVVPATEEDPADFASLVDLNLSSVFALTQLAGARMLAQGSGSVVNIASVYGMVASGSLPQAAYAASKGGLVNLTRELAAQWARRGVRVNAICPGWFHSEMTTEMLDNDSGSTWVNRRTPMGRSGSAGELDGALLFLASAASSYVTGAVLPVDGGYLAI